jgi:pilus assembly protein CpaF
MAVSDSSHVISIIGGKGGVGKSILAANLAIAFSREMRSKVLLMDLDSETCGDQNVILGVKPQKTIGELVTFSGQINEKTISSLVSSHPSGIHYLGAVRSSAETLEVDPSLIHRPFDQMSKLFPYIVADLGTIMTPLQMTILEKSSVVLVVTNPDLISVNHSYKAIGELQAATLPGELLQVIVNKAAGVGLSSQQVAATLKRNVIGSLPQDDRLVGMSLQRNTPFLMLQPQSQIAAATHEIVRKLTTGGVLQKLKALARPTGLKSKSSLQKASGAVLGAQSAAGSRGPGPVKLDPRNMLKERVHKGLITAMDLKKGITETKNDPSKEKALRQKTQQVISQILDREERGMPRDERSQIIKEVLDEALGLGPLEDLLSDDSVTEIMVNGHDKIYAERNGRVQLSPITFTSNLQLRNVIERIITPIGRRIDEKTPYQDARLRDGSRVNAVIEPLAIDGPSLTIRKFAKTPITPSNYLNWNTLNQAMMDFLRICVENGLNIIISGGTGSGKTTLLNVLSGYIPVTERIITVEDSAELQLKQEHVVRLETRPANMEGEGEIGIRDLVRNTLRMRPDRIIVGECRDGAALDMLAAMNTGHDGSMTTVHANNPREATSRLENLCLMAGMDLPVRAIREQIAGAVDLFVQISRLSDGSRKVISITEVIGIQSDKITLQEIFRFKEEGFDKNRRIVGQYQATGFIPSFVEKLERKGVKIPRSIFSNTSQGDGNAPPKAPPPMRRVGGGKK